MDNLIGAYRAENETGWAGYDKEGRTTPVSPSDAESLEVARCERNAKSKKPKS